MVHVSSENTMDNDNNANRTAVQARVAGMRGELDADLEAHSMAAMSVMAKATELAAATETAAGGGMDRLRRDLEAVAAVAERVMAARGGSSGGPPGALPLPGDDPPATTTSDDDDGRAPLPEDVRMSGEVTVPSNPAVRDAVRLAVPMLR